MTSKMVKSGARALEVMEFFADAREASVMEVARSLGYPQSSASQLLQSLVRQDYLRYEPQRRTFRASARAGLLGAALSERVFGGANVAALLDEIARSENRRAHVCDFTPGRVDYVAGPSWPAQPLPPSAPMHDAAAGRLHLSRLCESELDLWLAPPARPGAQGGQLVQRDMTAALDAIRRAGYARWMGARASELALALSARSRLVVSLDIPVSASEPETYALVGRVRAMIRKWRAGGEARPQADAGGRLGAAQPV